MGKGPSKGSRPDLRPNLPSSGEGVNAMYLDHAQQVMELGKQEIDLKSRAQVQQRIDNYFALCKQNDMKPSVAGYALAFGCTRASIWNWTHNIQTSHWSPESLQELKRGYMLINAQLEDYMQNGKIHPVAGIFLMKNNMDYEDRREYAVGPQNALGSGLSADELKKKYLEGIEAEAVPALAESAEDPQKD